MERYLPWNLQPEERLPALIGVLLAVAIFGVFWVYIPMSENYEQCGQVTLCPNPEAEVSDG